MIINHRLNAILIIGLTLGFGFTIAVVSAAPPITVTSAVPAEAEQGTTNLTVIINGRGFDNNMDVKFCRSETNDTCVDGGVDVKGSVEFISSKQLKVTVDVDVNANIGNNDIEVESLSSRRRGRGIEKFAVLKAGGGGGGGDGTMPATVTFRDDPNNPGDPFDRVLSDGNGPYIDDDDKVSTAIGHEGSFYLSLTKSKKQAIRTLRFDFSQCVVAGECNPPPCGANCIPVTGKIDGAGENLSAMSYPNGTGVEALFIVVNFGDENGRVFFVQFDSANIFDSEPNCPSADADVTRIDLHTWVIEGQTACLVRPGGAKDPGPVVRGIYNMPFKMTVKTN